jgi:hypothetical protein
MSQTTQPEYVTNVKDNTTRICHECQRQHNQNMSRMSQTTQPESFRSIRDNKTRIHQVCHTQHIIIIISICFTSCSGIFSFIWRRHHYGREAAKFRPMLGTKGLQARWDLYRATPAVTQSLMYFSLSHRKDHPI